MISHEKFNPWFSPSHRMAQQCPSGVKQDAWLSTTSDSEMIKTKVACFDNTRLIWITIPLSHQVNASLYLQPLHKFLALIHLIFRRMPSYLSSLHTRSNHFTESCIYVPTTTLITRIHVNMDNTVFLKTAPSVTPYTPSRWF